MLKGNHRYADVRFVLLEKFLGIIGAIEGLAVGILARSGVIAADDEMGAAVIFADDPVPDGFARAAHAHGQREHGQFHGRLRVL